MKDLDNFSSLAFWEVQIHCSAGNISPNKRFKGGNTAQKLACFMIVPFNILYFKGDDSVFPVEILEPSRFIYNNNGIAVFFMLRNTSYIVQKYFFFEPSFYPH